MNIVGQIEQWIVAFSNIVPLPIFVMVGSLIEEIVAPIPSPIVLTAAGTIILSSHIHWANILWVSVLAGVFKTLGTTIFYVISDKVEDFIVGRWGKLLGLSHKNIESLGKHFDGSIRDGVILTVLRAIPLMPSLPVSVACGIIKVDMKVFLVSSFIGFTIRSIFFLWLGYAGLGSLENLQALDSLESIIQIMVVGGAGVLLAWLYVKRGKGELHEIIMKKVFGSKK